MNLNGEGAERPCARADSRDSLFIMTVVRDMEGHEIGRARVRNLSATGMMIDYCAVSAPEGTRLVFAIRGVGEIEGEIIRRDGAQTGVRFLREIDPSRARASSHKLTSKDDEALIFRR